MHPDILYSHMFTYSCVCNLRDSLILVKQLQFFAFLEESPEFLNVSLLIWVCKMVGVVQPVPQVSDVVMHKVPVVQQYFFVR